MAHWSAYPYAGEFKFDAASVKHKWSRLHAGDLEPLPDDPQVLQVWADYHNGLFHQATKAALKLGLKAMNVAHKASCMYARYLEPHEACRLDLFLGVAERAQAQMHEQPDNLNAAYWHAFALGHYCQGLSVAKALGQGLDARVKAGLESVIRRQPEHADAHVVLGSFHAGVIDKVGSLIGAMAYGVNKDIGLTLFARALALNDQAAFPALEQARALLKLGGDDLREQARQHYQVAAGVQPADATERLEVELARRELAA